MIFGIVKNVTKDGISFIAPQKYITKIRFRWEYMLYKKYFQVRGHIRIVNGKEIRVHSYLKMTKYFHDLKWKSNIKFKE